MTKGKNLTPFALVAGRLPQSLVFYTEDTEMSAKHSLTTEQQ